MRTATRYRGCTRRLKQTTGDLSQGGHRLGLEQEKRGSRQSRRVTGQKEGERGRAQVSVPLLPTRCCPPGLEAKGKFRGATT